MTQGKELTFAPPGSREEIAEIAEGITSGATQASLVLEQFSGDDEVDMYEILKPLKAVVERVKSGNLADMEEMLVAQALALQGVFTLLAANAHPNEAGMQKCQQLLTLALKAQAQCRATVQALGELKFPRQTVFAKQANVANGPQQVNNGTNSPARARTETVDEVPNKQLEVSADGGERLEFGAAQSAKRGDPAMAPVGKVHRAEDTGREGEGV